MAKNKNGYGQGTFIDTRLFLSPAFMSLGQPGTAPRVSCCSAQVLILLLGKRKFGTRQDKKGSKIWERTDENKFTLTYKELESYGISQKRVTRAIDELLAKGFIEIINPGGLYDKDKAIYGLTDDYRKWRPGNSPIRTRSRDVQRGYQGKKISQTPTEDRYTDAHGGHPTKRHGR